MAARRSGDRSARGPRGRGSRWLGIVYLAVAGLVSVVVLPSALRPPPDQTQSSAAFSPDAPPEDQAETVLQSLRQAGSRTAGGLPAEEEEGPGELSTTTTTIQMPSRGRCFGDPPRQTESPYSPPCREAFTGDNGGATHKNVTGDEVKVGFWHAAGMPRERGDVQATPPSGESSEHRTARVIQQYFNERYELYGRRIQLHAIPGSANTEEQERAQAVQADSDGVFISNHLYDPFCEEMARRDLMCFSTNGSDPALYDRLSPHIWSYVPDLGLTDAITAEYACKKLVGRTSDFAQGRQHGLPRKIAVIVESTDDNQFRHPDRIVAGLRDQCGYEPGLVAAIDPGDYAVMSTTLARLVQDNYTTVLLHMGIVGAGTLFAMADGQDYTPEWVFVNSYGMEISDIARLVPSPQLAQAFGLSPWELPRPFSEWDCYRAYKSIDAAGEPNRNWCRLIWPSVEHMVNGIQQAGPDLNPETFRQGLYRMPLGEARAPWAIGGRYSNGDHSFVDDFAEIWWSYDCRDPDGGEPGCWYHTQEGERFRLGELDTETRVFQEGTAGYAASSP